jgi:hypothetical protein
LATLGSVFGVWGRDVGDDDVRSVVVAGRHTNRFQGVGQKQVLASTFGGKVHRQIVPRVDDGGVELDALTDRVFVNPTVKGFDIEIGNVAVNAASDKYPSTSPPLSSWWRTGWPV